MIASTLKVNVLAPQVAATVATRKNPAAMRMRLAPLRAVGSENDAPAPQEPAVASTPAPAPAVPTKGLGELMAFSGPIPETANGRLAMLGFVAALGAELSTHESVVQQIADAPALVALTFVIFMSASAIPLLLGKGDAELGPFKKTAEMLNGRAAMIGLASMLVIEAVRGSALF